MKISGRIFSGVASILLLFVPLIRAEDATNNPNPEQVVRACFDFAAGLTNFSVDCMRLEDTERRTGKSYIVYADLPSRLQVFHDAYFDPHIWDYAAGNVTIFLPASGELRHHPAEVGTFPFAVKDHPDPVERGLHNSLFLPDLVSGHLAGLVLSNAVRITNLTVRSMSYNGFPCQQIRVEQKDQTAYELLIQKGDTPFIHSIKRVAARTNIQSELPVGEKILAEEMYRQWQRNSPEIPAHLSKPVKPEPVVLSEEDVAIRDQVIQAAGGYQPQPIPAQTESCYQDRIRRQFTKLYRDKVLAQADPDMPCRDEVARFLDAYINHLATEQPDVETLLAQTTELMGKTPEIPLVAYGHACMLTAINTANPLYVGIPQQTREEIIQNLEAAYAGFQSPQWSHPYLAMRSAYRRAMAGVNPDPVWGARAWTDFRRLLDDPDMVEHYGDQLVSDWADLVRAYNSPLAKQRLEKMREFKFLEETRPWLYHMLMGVGYLCEGWDKDEYLRAQDDNIRQAIVHLAKAYELEPKRPEAAGYMITVMLASGGGRAAMRQWFDRAVQAEMDYLPAYDNYIVILFPVWGGDDGSRQAFGVECLQTRRFDTRVPGYYLDAIEALAKRDAVPRATFRQPGCYENLMALLDGYEHQADAPRGADYWESRKAVYAWACGRAPAAAEILAALGDRFDASGLQFFGTDPRRFLEEVWTQSGTHAGEYRSAVASLAAGDIGAARQTIGNVLTAVSAEDPARPYFQRLASRCDVAEAWNNGEWVSLMSPDEIAWECSTGGWKFDGQNWMCTSENGLDAQLNCHFPLTGDCELEGAIEFVEVIPASKYRYPTRTLNLLFGVPFDGHDPHSGVRIGLRDRPAQAEIGGTSPDRGLGAISVADITVGGRNEFRLRRQGGKLAFWWGGTLVADGFDLKMEKADQKRPGSFSLQVYDGKTGKFVVRLDGVRARRLEP